MNIKKTFPLSPVLLISAPTFVAAQSGGSTADPDLTYFETLVTSISSIFNLLFPVLLSLAIILFVFGVIRYVLAADDPEKRKSARGYIIWGLIALAIIFSIWGVIAFFQQITGIDPGTVQRPDLPN